MPAPRPVAGGTMPTADLIMMGLKLQGKVGLSQSQRNYIKIAKAFASRLRGRNLAIDVTALSLLADPRVSEEIRDRAIARAERGERITRREAENLIYGIAGK
jgi:hypothetical protein